MKKVKNSAFLNLDSIPLTWSLKLLVITTILKCHIPAFDKIKLDGFCKLGLLKFLKGKAFERFAANIALVSRDDQETAVNRHVVLYYI